MNLHLRQHGTNRFIRISEVVTPYQGRLCLGFRIAFNRVRGGEEVAEMVQLVEAAEFSAWYTRMRKDGWRIVRETA